MYDQNGFGGSGNYRYSFPPQPSDPWDRLQQPPLTPPQLSFERPWYSHPVNVYYFPNCGSLVTVHLCSPGVCYDTFRGHQFQE